MSSYQYMILRVMNEHKWSRAFSTQYVMERHYNGMSHQSAIRAAIASPYVSRSEIPKGLI
jgi:hypothetical protein